MANNEKSKNAKSSLKQKLSGASGWIKNNIRMIGAVVVVLGLGFGLGWWVRSADVKEAQTSLSQVTTERDEAKSELESYGMGDCYDPYSGIGGPCPSVTVVEAKHINDSELPSGFYFVSAEVEFENKHDNSIIVSTGGLTLKDDKSYVYPTASAYDWNGQKEITYDSITSIGMLSDQGDINLAKGEKVRGTLVFEVSRMADSFTLNYATVKSNQFSL